MRSTRSAIAQEILATFGPQVSDQLLAANNNIRFNFFVDDMAIRLSHTAAPLTSGRA
jgi:predicted Rdx family selenoprotein